MKFYRDPETSQVYAYEADGSQDDVIRDGLIRMTAAEIELHLAPRQPTQEQVQAIERAWRDGAVTNVAWLRDRHRDEREMDRDTTLSAGQFTQLLDYLQALRDWPQAEQFPNTEYRPVAPTWIVEQRQ